ncbi:MULTISPECIES: sporulation histidine kinase inhibitor Sda [Paenibacillus]|uniref:Sporulation inhibitor A n=1 Tax=Paenibacillus naphthalenovorans TaxID=162209 RepID=A0A0U2UED2_9BACL|nr:MULTISPECIES: sporulation histidine kinase inhibitor Sda [Paenibacillus]ALS21580.1 sporulation inhibitor A [Paenibacillus naphthalenovorans]NTZ18262.1 sporulation histidine kinase inhibitor Sda [Paenibacillus sp. JMULE4]GCL71306.1 sporulation histidine kinase inhibitor Sda [Paenibacillus naphthalenovorans]SDI74154.1 Sporulation inhibitor A [Paenibacillus naphthalenovorans]
MRRISDVALIHAYKLAIELDLDRDFIKMLEKEIERRGMNIPTLLKKQEE